MIEGKIGPDNEAGLVSMERDWHVGEPVESIEIPVPIVYDMNKVFLVRFCGPAL